MSFGLRRALIKFVRRPDVVQELGAKTEKLNIARGAVGIDWDAIAWGCERHNVVALHLAEKLGL
jgi:hypothetical protein